MLYLGSTPIAGTSQAAISEAAKTAVARNVTVNDTKKFIVTSKYPVDAVVSIYEKDTNDTDYFVNSVNYAESGGYPNGITATLSYTPSAAGRSFSYWRAVVNWSDVSVSIETGDSVDLKISLQTDLQSLIDEIADRTENVDMPIFTGTLQEWNALTEAEKQTYQLVNITDDSDANNLVDEITLNSIAAVTSNAVAKYVAAPGFNNAGSHNAIYRGKFLGGELTVAQKETITNGEFEDLYIGDYWTIGGVNYRIAAFDYWLGTGNTECIYHHVVIVPDTCLDNSIAMNDTDTTIGGYVGSKAYTTYLDAAKAIVVSAFTTDYILQHREFLTNAVADGAASGWAWYDSTIELMNEVMVYGTKAWGNDGGKGNGYDVGIDKTQLPLFLFRPDLITNRVSWWLRSVVSAASFAFVANYGRAGDTGASAALGVRPAFAIYGGAS